MKLHRGVDASGVTMIVVSFLAISLGVGYLVEGAVNGRLDPRIAGYAALICGFGFSFVAVGYGWDWTRLQDFVTSHGTAVWTSGIPEITPELMEKALDHFIAVLGEEQSEVSPEQIREALKRTRIDWRLRPSIWLSNFCIYAQDTGIREGFRNRVVWPGSVADSLLYHLLLHEINCLFRRNKYVGRDGVSFARLDESHMEPDWWRLEGALGSDF